MRTLFILTVALLTTISVSATDGFDKLFSKYADSDNVTSVNISSSMLGLVSNFLGEEDKEAKELLSNIKSVKLLATEEDNPTLSRELLDLVKSSDLEELMRVNEEGSTVRIMVKEVKEIIKEVIVYVDGEDETVFINIVGDIDPAKVGEVMRTLDIDVDIDGLELEE